MVIFESIFSKGIENILELFFNTNQFVILEYQRNIGHKNTNFYIIQFAMYFSATSATS